MRRVIPVAYFYLQTINRIIKFIAVFGAAPTNCTETGKKVVKKANLIWLVKPADLSQISSASQPPAF